MPEIECYRLAPEPLTLTAAELALQNRPSTPLAQPWRPAPQPEFRPAAARAFWTDTTVGVCAELQDGDIFNDADGENQQFWELGDVFEIFLRPLPGAAYWEFHVTPNNDHLQLRFDSEEMFHSRIKNMPANWLDGTGLPPHSFKAEVQVERDREQWRVCAWFPLTLFNLPRPVQKGDAWLVNFCRYDYTRGGGKVLSTSARPTPKPSFHRNDSWRTLRMV